eukprot:gene39400-48693_t
MEVLINTLPLQLTSIDLSRSAFLPLAALSKRFNGLTTLNLSHTAKCDDFDAQFRLLLQANQNTLTSLDVSYCADLIKDTAFDSIAMFGKELRTLNISGCYRVPPNIATIALGQLGNLTHLSLVDCSQIPRDMIENQIKFNMRMHQEHRTRRRVAGSVGGAVSDGLVRVAIGCALSVTLAAVGVKSGFSSTEWDHSGLRSFSADRIYWQTADCKAIVAAAVNLRELSFTRYSFEVRRETGIIEDCVQMTGVQLELFEKSPLEWI